MMGGSCPDPKVLQIMDKAAEYWVDMFDLQLNAGRLLKDVLGCEDGIVTSGAYAANSIATEACLVMSRSKNPPLTQPEVICQSSHITNYAHSFTTSGVRIREVSKKEVGESLTEYIGENTIALTYVLNESSFEFSLRETMEAGKKVGLPVIVDAAVVDPPIKGIKEVLNYEPDFVSVSGGKGLNGPNGTGLLLGSKEAISVARKLAFPNYGPGRGMKVSKEEIAGLMSAVLIAAGRDEDALVQNWRHRAEVMREKLRDIPHTRTEVIFPWSLNFPQPVPRLMLYIDRADGEEKATIVRESLLKSSPSVFTRPPDSSSPKNAILFDLRVIKEEDISRVAKVVRTVLGKVLVDN